MDTKKFLSKIFRRNSKDIAGSIGKQKQHFDDGGQVSWEQAQQNLPDVSHMQDVTGINFQDPDPVNYAQGAARLADSYTGAPVRAAIGAMGRGASASEAYGNQFGENPEHAPTGEQLMEQAGVENSVGKTLGGLGLDIGTDPSNYIPAKTLGAMLAVGALKKGKAALETGEAAADIAKSVMSKRMKNAEKMGFDTGTTVYHGTKGDVHEFDPSYYGSGSGEEGQKKAVFWFSDNPRVAQSFSELAPTHAWEAADQAHMDLLDHEGEMQSRADQLVAEGKYLDADLAYKNDQKLYDMEAKRQELEQRRDLTGNQGANIIPAHVKLQNPLELEMHGMSVSRVRDKMNKTLSIARSKGHDGVIFYDLNEGGNTPSNVYAVFKPEQIRSKFAEFNPKKKKSGNITAGIGGATLLGTGAASQDNKGE